MRSILLRAAAAAIAITAFHAAPAAAHRIVLTNDDGLTSNVVALYRALKADGHDVVVSVPCTNQSGMGAALHIGRPLAPLAEPCLNDAAEAGAPGAGPMTRSDLPRGDFFYVAGTPVMALLYGLDVEAARRWGAEPDLVLSGPNEGQNVGAVILSSGTVSNAQYAAVRGIPAIALSAGANSAGDKGLDNPESKKVGRLSADLVRTLDAQAKGGPLLPPRLALNVNFPDKLAGAKWRVSQVGTYNAYKLDFVENMASSASPTLIAMAKQHGAELPPLPGLAFDFNQQTPLPDQVDDESVVYRTDIAVSAMQAGYAAQSAGAGWLAGLLAVVSAHTGK
jgi:5'-nucleotidase